MNTREAGFTLIEVMTAVVVMTIGASGILAMQGATIHANQDAQETGVATNFAATWIERIKRDARLWTAAGNADLANTRYLGALANADRTATYIVPPRDELSEADKLNESSAANHQGFDVHPAQDGTLSGARFCVNLRLTVVHAYDPLTGGIAATSNADAVRADVRVWWHRRSDEATRMATCLEQPLSDDEAKKPQFRKQHLSTVVRYRPAGWP